MSGSSLTLWNLTCDNVFQSENIPIKLNAAAILREGKLYQKREQEELKKYPI